MELQKKIVNALQYLEPIHLRLEKNGGITGVVVSSQFSGKSSLDRQKLISNALRAARDKLSSAELARISVIAAFTPVEYEVLREDGRL